MIKQGDQLRRCMLQHSTKTTTSTHYKSTGATLGSSISKRSELATSELPIDRRAEEQKSYLSMTKMAIKNGNKFFSRDATRAYQNGGQEARYAQRGMAGGRPWHVGAEKMCGLTECLRLKRQTGKNETNRVRRVQTNRRAFVRGKGNRMLGAAAEKANTEIRE